jgi:uncharacterized protein YdhG (YjbR/CyaY superfamily)
MSPEVEVYIHSFEESIRKRLLEVYQILASELPQVPCVMNYGIPTFKMEKNIIHFGGFKKHIGIYPGPKVIVALEADLSGYTCSKGAIQLPLDQRLPITLLRKIVKHSKKQYEQAIKMT